MLLDARPLSAEEMRVLRALAAGIDREFQPDISSYIDQVRVRPVNSHETILEFVYSDYERPDQGQMLVGHEGELLDSDGAQVDVLLYWDRNLRLSEFEFLRWGDGEVISLQWNSFRLK